MRGRLRLITAPAKLHARVDHDLEDDLLATFIAAARQHGEQLTGRQFVEAEFELLLEAFPHGNGPIRLPRPPLLAIEAVAYVDRDGEQRTLAAACYHAQAAGTGGAIHPAEGATWPDTPRQPDAVAVRFRTGWPVRNGAATTPEAIQAWILARVTGLYEQREAAPSPRCPGTSSTGSSIPGAWPKSASMPAGRYRHRITL